MTFRRYRRHNDRPRPAAV